MIDIITTLCLLGFVCNIVSGYFLAVPPEKIQPVPTQYLGRLSFLTFQTNVLCAIFYAGVLLDMEAIATKMYPLAFALGVFLTLAYYGLDHFNLDQVRRRLAWQRDYPWVHASAHGEHASALPLTLLYACGARDRGLPAPSAGDIYAYASQDFAGHFCGLRCCISQILIPPA